MRPDELECRLRERLDALGPAPRAELLHVLMLPDFERADRIGEFWSQPRTEPSSSRCSLGSASSRSTSTEVSDIIGRWRRRFIQAVGEASASAT